MIRQRDDADESSSVCMVTCLTPYKTSA